MKQGQLTSYKGKKELDPHTSSASRPGGIKEAGCEKHTLKLSGANAGEYLYDLRVETGFLNKTKSTNQKRKRVIVNHVKLPNFS